MKIFGIEEFIKEYNDSKDFLGFFIYLRDQIIELRSIINDSIGTEEYNRLHDSINDLILFLNTKNDVSISERLRGAIYTPKVVCRLINNRAFNYCCAEKIVVFPKILDPSCGFGFFLIDFLFLMLQNKIEKDFIYSILKNERMKGIDIDQKSIELSRSIFLILFLFIIIGFEGMIADASYYKTIGNLYFNLKKHISDVFECSNFLIMKKEDISGSFDIIVGNPPYIRVHKIEKQLNEFLRNNYFTPFKDFDIYICFFEQSLKFLSRNGVLGFITPEKYLSREYAKKLRLLLLTNSFIKEIIDVSRCKDIFNAFIYPIITILVKKTQELIYSGEINGNDPESMQKNNDLKIRYIRIEDDFQPNIKFVYDLLNSNQVPNVSLGENTIYYGVSDYSDFLNRAVDNNLVFTFSTTQELSKLDEIFKDFYKIGDLIPSEHIFCGTPRAKDYKNLKNAIFEEPKVVPKEFPKYIVSRNLIPFKVVWGIKIDSIAEKYYKPYFNLNRGPFSVQVIKNFMEKPKILISGNGKKIIAAIDNEGFVFNGIYAISLNNIMKIIDEDTLLMILNSDLINYYILHKFSSYMMNSKYLSINSAIIEAIPLPIKIISKNNPSPVYSLEKMHLIEKIKNLLKDLNVKLDVTIKLYVCNDALANEIREYFFKELKRCVIDRKANIKKMDYPDENLFKENIIKILLVIKELNKIIYDLYGIPENIKQIIEKD